MQMTQDRNSVVDRWSVAKQRLLFQTEEPWQVFLDASSPLVRSGRLVLFLLWTAWFVFNLYYHVVVRDGGLPLLKFWVNLDTMSSALLAIYLGLSALLTFQASRTAQPNGESRTPLAVSSLLGLGAVFPAGPVLICILYWTLQHKGGVPHWTTLINQNGPLLVALSEFFTSKRTLHPEQIYPFLIFAFSYTAFTYVYFLLKGDSIYAVMDWSKPQRALTLAALLDFVAVPSIYLLTVALSAFKVWLHGHGAAAESAKFQLLPPQVDPEISNSKVEVEESKA